MRIHEVLSEVSMRPTTLKSFASGEGAQGIRAGFEAELCFRGKLESYQGRESEEDYDQDERVSDIDDIIRFFRYETERSDLSRLENHLKSDYEDWKNEQIEGEWVSGREDVIRDSFINDGFDSDERAVELMVNSGYDQEDAEKNQRQHTEAYRKFRDQADEELEEKVKDSIRFEDRDYKNSRDEFYSEKENEYSNSEREWLREKGITYASDVVNAYEISWPYWTNNSTDEDGFNESSADNLVPGLQNAVGSEFDIVVSTGYGEATRNDKRWIIEPDGSISPDDSDDLAVEIISPPMDLNVCLEKLDSFAAWAKSEGAYSNDSTGFHVGVSLPEKGGRVDYIKLAMFLGDTYVLEQFSRASNTYAKKAQIELEKHIKSKPNRGPTQVVTNALQLMHKGLMTLAASSIMSINSDRYLTINMKSDYVEFRAMGGSDYLTNLEQTKNTIMRYAYAMNIAGDPEMYKREYAKKLYKMLNPEGRMENTKINIAELISEYTAGTLDRSKLTSLLDLRRKSNTTNLPAQPDQRKTYMVIDKLSGNVASSFIANSDEEAVEKVKDRIKTNNQDVNDYKLIDSDGTQLDISVVPQAKQRWSRWIIYNRENQPAGAVVARTQDEADTTAAAHIRNYGGDPSQFVVRQEQI